MALPRGVTAVRLDRAAARPRGRRSGRQRGDLRRRVSRCSRARPRHLAPGVPVLSVSKGLARAAAARSRSPTPSRRRPGSRIVTVGGPSKALELARRVPTAVIYASPAGAALRAPPPPLARDAVLPRRGDRRPARHRARAPRSRTPTRSPSGSATASSRRGRAEAMYNTKSAALHAGAASRSSGSGAPCARGPGPSTASPVAPAICTSPAWPGRNRIFGELRGSGRSTKAVVATLRRATS